MAEFDVEGFRCISSVQGEDGRDRAPKFKAGAGRTTQSQFESVDTGDGRIVGRMGLRFCCLSRTYAMEATDWWYRIRMRSMPMPIRKKFPSGVLQSPHPLILLAPFTLNLRVYSNSYSGYYPAILPLALLFHIGTSRNLDRSPGQSAAALLGVMQPRFRRQWQVWDGVGPRVLCNGAEDVV